MNLFFLDENPRIAARFLCDKHVPKLILEANQLLCTALWRYDIECPYAPLPPHYGKKIIDWICESLSNWQWSLEHLDEMMQEKLYRFPNGSINYFKCSHFILSSHLPIEDIGLTPPHLAIKDYPGDNSTIASAVESYRRYYIMDKRKFAEWKYTDAPFWWTKD